MSSIPPTSKKEAYRPFVWNQPFRETSATQVATTILNENASYGVSPACEIEFRSDSSEEEEEEEIIEESVPLPNSLLIGERYSFGPQVVPIYTNTSVLVDNLNPYEYIIASMEPDSSRDYLYIAYIILKDASHKEIIFKCYFNYSHEGEKIAALLRKQCKSLPQDLFDRAKRAIDALKIDIIQTTLPLKTSFSHFFQLPENINLNFYSSKDKTKIFNLKQGEAIVFTPELNSDIPYLVVLRYNNLLLASRFRPVYSHHSEYKLNLPADPFRKFAEEMGTYFFQRLIEETGHDTTEEDIKKYNIAASNVVREVLLLFCKRPSEVRGVPETAMVYYRLETLQPDTLRPIKESLPKLFDSASQEPYYAVATFSTQIEPNYAKGLFYKDETGGLFVYLFARRRFQAYEKFETEESLAEKAKFYTREFLVKLHQSIKMFTPQSPTLKKYALELKNVVDGSTQHPLQILFSEELYLTHVCDFENLAGRRLEGIKEANHDKILELHKRVHAPNVSKLSTRKYNESRHRERAQPKKAPHYAKAWIDRSTGKAIDPDTNKPFRCNLSSSIKRFSISEMTNRSKHLIETGSFYMGRFEFSEVLLLMANTPIVGAWMLYKCNNKYVISYKKEDGSIEHLVLKSKIKTHDDIVALLSEMKLEEWQHIRNFLVKDSPCCSGAGISAQEAFDFMKGKEEASWMLKKSLTTPGEYVIIIIQNGQPRLFKTGMNIDKGKMTLHQLLYAYGLSFDKYCSYPLIKPTRFLLNKQEVVRLKGHKQQVSDWMETHKLKYLIREDLRGEFTLYIKKDDGSILSRFLLQSEISNGPVYLDTIVNQTLFEASRSMVYKEEISSFEMKHLVHELTEIAPRKASKYEHQLVLSLVDDGGGPLHAKFKSKHNERPADLIQLNADMPNYSLLSKVTSKSRIYIVGHSNRGKDYIASDSLPGNYYKKTVQEFLGMFLTYARHLVQKTIDPKRKKPVVSLVACYAALGDLEHASFCVQFCKAFYEAGIDLEVHGRTGPVKRITTDTRKLTLNPYGLYVYRLPFSKIRIFFNEEGKLVEVQAYEKEDARN